MTRARPSFTTIDFRRRFPALDGIRALAVTMVFAFHYGGGSQRGMLLRGVNAIRLRGWMGVDLFFVLSGFLITGILYDTRLRRSLFPALFLSPQPCASFRFFISAVAVMLLLTPVFRYQWRAGHLWFLVYLGNFALASDADALPIASADHPAAAAHIWAPVDALRRGAVLSAVAAGGVEGSGPSAAALDCGWTCSDGACSATIWLVMRASAAILMELAD